MRFNWLWLLFAGLVACAARRPAGSSEVKEGGLGRDRNLAAGGLVVYEVQLRTANACDPRVGTSEQKAACLSKVAPTIPYRAEGMTCNMIEQLKAIRLGTINDMLADSDDSMRGITTRYIKDSVGANTLWIIPPFPNNDRWNIPDSCDDLGSPYAVRDYFHVAGTLSQACIQSGQDEYSPQPCWGNGDFDELIKSAHAKGLKVLLDVAFNHLGHNYLMYDYQDYRTVSERINGGESLDSLWDFAGTYEQNLERPLLLDSKAILEQRAGGGGYHFNVLSELKAKCPSLDGDRLVRGYNLWRNALSSELENFSCDGDLYLETVIPGFFLGENTRDPSRQQGDNFSNSWRDVKFVYHHEANVLHQHEYIRNREYLFRVLNYWSSRGVDGFRFDHATEGANGLSPNFWKYLTQKVNYYAARRGQDRPVYMAEEFTDQFGMAEVVDFMTEGYVFNINGRRGETKNSGFVEGAVANGDRFGGNTLVMTALETHDEPRLTEGTGYNRFTGAGFWGVGAASLSTPMLLMGQEFGETYGLGFRRSDYLRARFPGSPTYFEKGQDLRRLYQSLIEGRLREENRALRSSARHFLRLKEGGGLDDRIFAMMKWSQDGNVVLAFHNLWEQDVANHYFIPQGVAEAALLRDDLSYRLVDIISNEQMGTCRTGAELKWDLPVVMGAATRIQWLRLERCP